MIEIKVHPPSGTIILKRSDKRNALTRPMLAQLLEAFGDLHQERQVRAVIVTGAGTAFCSGLDLAEMHATAQSADAMTRWHEDMVQYKELLETMLRFPKPIIAAVNGPCVAAGAGLLLASDLVVGTPEAQFGIPEPRRGLVSGLVSPLLVFRIGAGRAAHLLLTGQLIDAQQALQLGLYHELAAENRVWARAHQLAGQIAESAPESLQLTKRLLNETIGESLGMLLAAGAAASATARTTQSAQEGLAAFVEKRAPNWP